MQEYTEEMQYICKKDKVNQEKRTWESKYKTTVIEFKELKDRYKEMQKEKKEIERKYAGIKELCNLKSINLKLVTKTGHQDKEKRTEKYSKHEITQLSRCYACGSQEYQIKDSNTDRNIFVRYSRDDTMDVQELQNIMAEYGKIKSIKVIHHQYGGAENRATICYEIEMESQRSIAEINSYKGWRAEKYKTNKATGTANKFKGRTHTSSRETETEEKDREKTNQTDIKDERTCHACGTKEHKSKLNITFKENLSSQDLRRIMEEDGTVKSTKIKEVQRGQKKTGNGLFLKGK